VFQGGINSLVRKKVRGAVCEGLEGRRLMAFGLSSTASSYTVDTGANLIFSINRTTALGGSVGDLQSMKFNGIELGASFSDTNRYSHYESGLKNGAVVTAITDPSGNWIEIVCDDTGAGGVGVIQYYIARKGFNNIYMATYAPGPDSPSPGEVRFITYTNHSVLSDAPAASNLVGNTGNVESTDVFGFADGTTASKYYGETEIIDDAYHGVTGGGFGVFMNMGNRESSSGGPFMKDIDFQTTSAQSTEVYNYMFSGHSQTENFRPGLQGPYALEFDTGGTPDSVDYSFIDGLNLTGAVAAFGRGTLTGNANGVLAGHRSTVAISNSIAQYWGTPDSTTGNYNITGVKPGTYTETLYQDELAVGTQTITVLAGATTTTNITNTYYTPTAIFRIGTWDGTPIGFLNADKIQNMHPSDSRMSPWVNTTYTVGTTPDSTWPMAQWELVTGVGPTIDSTNTIAFNLTAAQASTAMTLRIGITRAGSNGRPIISINGGSFSNAPTASIQPITRGVTVGDWRGNNALFTYSISTSSLHAGSNTIAIGIASGSTDTSESSFLQPWVIYDAIDLVTTSSLTNAPHVASIAVTPSSTTLNPLQQQTFIASAKDQFGNAIPANFIWSASSGVIDGGGNYVAPAMMGSATITATSGTINGSAAVAVNLTNITGTANGDAIHLVRDGSALDVFINSVLTYSVSFASLGALTISAGDGDDRVILDFSGGVSPIPSAGITVDGGNGFDHVAIEGTSSSDTVTASSSSLMVDNPTIHLVNNELSELDPIGTQPILLASLSVAAGTTLNVDPAGLAVLELSNTPSLTGSLDLGNSQLIVTNGGATGLSSLTTYLKTGRNSGVGYWKGAGIISSVVAADPTLLTTLGIILKPNNDVVVQPTTYGDADLNLAVSGADYAQIDTGFGMHFTGWSYGDFNYDGVVDGTDYSLIDNAFNQITANAAAAVVLEAKTIAVVNNPVLGTVFADSKLNAWKLYIESTDGSNLLL
jgi:rhamnogalacturonan endolyase